MKITKEDFFLIGKDLNFPGEQVATFWQKLEQQNEDQPTPFTKWLFYLGALIVISALTWFINWSWFSLGGGGIFLIALAYASLFTYLGNLLWHKKGLKIPGGLLITMAVCMTPLAIYGLEVYFDVWPGPPTDLYRDFYFWIDENWIFLEAGTLIVGALALYYYPFPFLTVPLFVSAWFLTLDAPPLILGHGLSWAQKQWISIAFGLILMVVSFFIDRKGKEDFAFWGYFFGALTFWIGFSTLSWDKGEPVLFLYLIISIMMMALSILLRRNVFMVFGSMGVFGYLSHLAYNIFQNSVLFPFFLSFAGLAIIYLGILYQKHREKIHGRLLEKLPSAVQTLFKKND